MICPVCNSDHCPETNMDGTIGCCICYNKQMLIDIKEDEDESITITLCEGCKKYSSAYDGFHLSMDVSTSINGYVSIKCNPHALID